MSGQPAGEVLLPFFAAMRQLLIVFLFLFAGLHSTCEAQQMQVLDSIQLRRSVIEQVVITGNKKTREYIIRRELSFREGDTLQAYILESAIERSRQNLMNTALFNFVEIRYFQGIGDAVVVHINLTERWYLWPMPVFEIADRNINEWLQRKDLKRTNYGLYLRQENFTGRDDILQFQVLFGYTRRFGLYYTIPYINRKLNLGLSAGFYTTRQKEVSYNTFENKLEFYKDPEQFVRKETSAFLRFTKRQGLYNYYNTTIDYRKSSVADTIIALNDRYFFEPYPEQQHIGISWNYRYDKRDYQPYALKGHLIEVDATKIGIGLLPHEPNLIALALGIRYYQPLAKKWHLGTAVKGRIMQRAGGPFYNQRALGYGGDYIRGYDLYVLNGQDFALFRSNLKYTLLGTKVYQFGFMRTEKFKKFPISSYLNAFFDAGYVSDKQFAENNSLNNDWQFGYGLSLDIITYYDIILRCEYAINRLGDQGFYFRLGTVF
jgi:outer membrane protein assembly factor BamA